MTHQTAIPCMQLRGGSSKGVYFHARDLPADKIQRDKVLTWVIGAYGDPRQIDGLGGATALTAKIAVIAPAAKENYDVEYTFIQALVGKDEVDDTPNCGNLLAGVGYFALESGLLSAAGENAVIRVLMTNSGKFCTLQFPIRDGLPIYEGDTCIDGVAGTAARIVCSYENMAGAVCGALLPTGNIVDIFSGFRATCIDNGMPIVALRAADFGITGSESPQTLNADNALKRQIEQVRLQAGQAMGLGDVADKTIPKMCLMAPPRRNDGTLCTRTFIPQECHSAIGVFGAISAASAAILPGSVAHDLANIPPGSSKTMHIEHPSGALAVQIKISSENPPRIEQSAIIRTARLLARGHVYIPSSIWDNRKL